MKVVDWPHPSGHMLIHINHPGTLSDSVEGRRRSCRNSGGLWEGLGELPKPGEVKGHVPLRKMESPPTGSALLIPVRSPFGKTRAPAVGPENWDRDDGREDCGKDGEEQGGGTQLEAPVVSSSRHSRQTDEGAEPGQRAGHG